MKVDIISSRRLGIRTFGQVSSRKNRFTSLYSPFNQVFSIIFVIIFHRLHHLFLFISVPSLCQSWSYKGQKFILGFFGDALKIRKESQGWQRARLSRGTRNGNETSFKSKRSLTICLD